MRWLPERMPFSYRLLLAFTVPLLIWVLVSAASVYTLHRTQENYDALANAERTIALAHEYRSTVDVVLEAERAYLLTSSSQYLVEHREVMRRATALQDELGWRVRAQPEQVQRLERAGEVLQQWFYDYSRQRIEARRSLPYLGVRDAHLILQHMLAMLADEGDALPGEDLDELRGVLTALGEHAGEGRGAQVVQQAIEQLKRFESAASANDRAAAIDELRAVANHLLPALTGIIDAEHELYLMAMDERGSALVDEFNELVSTFIAEEQLIVERHRSRATMAAVTIHWIIWTGLAAGVILMLIVLIWFVRRLGDSIESIDHAAEELAKGNFGARARGEGSASKLAQHFNSMADLIEKRHEQTKLLARLGETLHNCRSITEALKVFGEFSSTLFPDHPGMLYLVEPNQVDVTAVADWNGGDTYSRPQLQMDDCWGLRLTRMHENGSGGTVRCAHLVDAAVDSLCVPLPAFGQIIGMIFIVLDDVDDMDTERNRQRQFVDTVAEQVALALANVKLREELRSQAIRDPLTRLYNRRHLEDVMDREVQRAERHSSPLAALAFDIDEFKDFNDTHGHDGGDAVLRGIGDTLRDFFRPEDGIFRTGGEEFIAILPGTTLEDAESRAEELRKTIEQMHVLLGNVRLPAVTISVGVAVFPDHAPDGERLLKFADIALYEAKKRGRNCVVSASAI